MSDAKARLTDLVRQAEAGEDVVLTHHGKPVARIVPVVPAFIGPARARLLEALQRSAARNATRSREAARSQDFLYNENGVPG